MSITQQTFKEWVFYDGQCRMCVGLSQKIKHTLNSKGIGLIPLQVDWVRKRTAHIKDPLKEMLFQTSKGEVLGGIDAVIFLARKIWWMYGIYLLSKIPGMRFVLERGYQWIARNRYCVSGWCRITYL